VRVGIDENVGCSAMHDEDLEDAVYISAFAPTDV
jgi:hypothetical protein